MMLFDPIRGRMVVVDNWFSTNILSRWDKEGNAPTPHNTSAKSPTAELSETINSVQTPFIQESGLV